MFKHFVRFVIILKYVYVLNALQIDSDTSYAQKYLQGLTGLTSIYKNKGKCFGGVIALSWHIYIYMG